MLLVQVLREVVMQTFLSLINSQGSSADLLLILAVSPLVS